MLETKEKIVIFNNKYIELQNNLVEDRDTKKRFNHIRLIENNSKTPGSVILCKHNNKFLIIENYRYGIDEITIELPRGYTNTDESLEKCAIRELYEETNIVFLENKDEIIKLGEISINSSIMASKVSIFLININHNVENIKLQHSEHIESFQWVSLQEMYEKIRVGEIIDSFTISALMLYKVYNRVEF